MEQAMWLIGLARADSWAESFAETRPGSELLETAREWPKPGELLLETGIILAAALGVAVGMEVILSALGIPPPTL
jgi:hypothetical protein